MTAVARTPLHHWHAAAGARFAEVDGWLLPITYNDAEREKAAASAGLALADVSAFAKLRWLVPSSDGAGQASGAGDVTQVAADDPALACRLAADELLLLAGAPSHTFRSGELTLGTIRGGRMETSTAPGVSVSDATCSLAGFWLLGADGAELLGHLTALDVSPTAFPPGSCAQTNLAGVRTLLVHPPAGVSPPSLGVYVPWELAEYVWGKLFEVGRRRGLVPLGHDALQATRLNTPR
jgi:glycine cleavage system aminomethyltransferase T